MPTLAKLIKINYEKYEGLYSFTIDGQEFPWYVSEAGFTIQSSNGNPPQVTLTIPAEKLELLDDWTEV